MAMYLTSLIAFTALILIPDLWFFMKMKKHHFYPLVSSVEFSTRISFYTFLFLYPFRIGVQFQLSGYCRNIVDFIRFSVIYTPKVLYIVFYYINHSFNRIFNAKTRIFRIIGFALSVYMVATVLWRRCYRDDFISETNIYM